MAMAQENELVQIAGIQENFYGEISRQNTSCRLGTVYLSEKTVTILSQNHAGTERNKQVVYAHACSGRMALGRTFLHASSDRERPGGARRDLPLDAERPAQSHRGLG